MLSLWPVLCIQHADTMKFSKARVSGNVRLFLLMRRKPGDLRTDTVSDEEETETFEKYSTYLKMIGVDPSEDKTQIAKKVEAFEAEAKRKFVDEPANMKLLIVVDKLLTGFDAPSCTYLYIDKAMHDHGLFQAICRVNRLDGESKDFGYIVDYKELFGDLADAHEPSIPPVPLKAMM